MYWDRLDICEAYYMFACEYHRGMFSNEYKIFGRLHALKFKPSPLLTKENMTENSRSILANLIRKYRKVGM